MNRFFATAAALAAMLLLVAGCGGKGSSGPAASNVQATAGDTVVTLTWDQDPSVDYMVFYAASATITTDNWSTLPLAHALLQAVPPKVVTGLLNGTTYYFTINSSKNGGPGGPGSPTVSATPRFAGATWTVDSPLGLGDMHGAAFGIIATVGTFVAVGANGAMFSSTDGFTWTPITLGSSASLNAVAYGGNFVAVGANGTIFYSTDAVNWTQETAPTSNDLYAVATTGTNTYVAVGANGTILTSSDGQSWTLVNGGTNNLYAITIGNGVYVAVGANGTVITSGDSANWTLVSSPTTADLRGVAWGNVIYPPTGIQTTSSTLTSTFVAVGTNGTLITSPDAGTWTSLPPISANSFTGLAFGTQFVAVGSGGAIYTSLDGSTWQVAISGTGSNLLGIGVGNHGYIALGTAGTTLTAY